MNIENIPNNMIIRDEKTGKRLDIYWHSKIFEESLHISNVEVINIRIAQYNDYTITPPERQKITREIEKMIEQHIKESIKLEENNINKIIFC